MNIPNILTTIRFLLIGLFIYAFYNHEMDYALIIFIVSGITDLLDGYIARKYNMITKWGKLLDPLADKLMILTVLISLYNKISIFVISIVILKEFIMVCGAVFLYKKGNVVVGSQWYGKAATVIFFIAIVFVMKEIPGYKEALWIAVAMALVSLLNYTFNFIRIRNSDGE